MSTRAVQFAQFVASLIGVMFIMNPAPWARWVTLAALFVGWVAALIALWRLTK